MSGSETEAVQFGGPTLRVLATDKLHRDPLLARLGSDVLAPAFDPTPTVKAFRTEPNRELGDALLDQRLIAGIGNVFKSEACFATLTSPWRRIAELADEELREVLLAARRLMLESVAKGRPDRGVYRRAGQPCPVCDAPILSRGQGDANRRTYWCPRCQRSQKTIRL